MAPTPPPSLAELAEACDLRPLKPTQLSRELSPHFWPILTGVCIYIYIYMYMAHRVKPGKANKNIDMEEKQVFNFVSIDIILGFLSGDLSRMMFYDVIFEFLLQLCILVLL